MKCSEIIAVMETIAPTYLAESWDNVGLQIGSQERDVNKVLLTLDITEEVVDEAIDKGVQLIIAHHPFIFNGLMSINMDELKGKLLEKMIKNDIGLYVAHTNLDKAELGLNDFIAQKLHIEKRKPLKKSEQETFYKIVVYVPVDYTQDILDVLGECGAGFIGNYSHCTFRTVGKGTFKPEDGADPFIGEEDELAVVEENRIESIVTGKILQNLISGLKAVHPYEEMAYDLYPLENEDLEVREGLGRIGYLKEAMPPDAFVEMVKDALQLDFVRTAGTPPDVVEKAALCTGSGAEFIGLAKVQGADVYITGDIKYHDAQRAEENNLWVIDAGHFGTEKMVVSLLDYLLSQRIDTSELTCYETTKNEDFMRFY